MSIGRVAISTRELRRHSTGAAETHRAAEDGAEEAREGDDALRDAVREAHEVGRGHWRAGVCVRGCIGAWVCRCIGVSVRRHIGVQVCGWTDAWVRMRAERITGDSVRGHRSVNAGGRKMVRWAHCS